MATRDADAAVRMRGVRVALSGVTVLSDINAFFVQAGINALIGPNGAGKTTLLKAMLGLTPFSGHVEFAPDESGRMPRAAYVPQRLDFDRGSPITVTDLLCADRQRRPLFLGASHRAAAQAHEKLRLVGADRLARLPLGKLSGGEFQRVLLALALLGDPRLLLLDEPVAGIDMVGEQLFCDLLVQLRVTQRMTIVIVSHDQSFVTQHADHVVCINDGVVQCEGNPSKTLTPDNIRRVFGDHIVLYDHGPHGHAHAHCDEQHGCGHSHADSHGHLHSHSAVPQEPNQA
ncbi:MAG: metal ABC transporter ATP-binding protein [Phycisphaerales bacterium]|nr:metal ABC transporter ATP-binding protein [Phycisphaerales bacterium]